MEFKFRIKDKTAFYWKYFILKVFYLWFEVKKPKIKVFIYEILYSAMKFVNYASMFPSPFKTNLVETRFGIFRIRPYTVDMSNVSPAFERQDIDYLLKLICKLKNENKKILFLDVGADIGTFTITVGNKFKDYENLHIMAFEPASSSYALLEENTNLNNLQEKVDVYNAALFSEDNKELAFQFNPDAPGSSSLKFSGAILNSQMVTTKTLDFILMGKANNCDVIIFKMDVEGVETEVLKGAEKILSSGMEVYLLIEDFINPAVINHLERIGAKFICKLTPYNSWWHIH